MPELLAFAEMSQEGRRPGVILRVWKQVDGALQLTLGLGLTLALTLALALSLTRSRACCS